METRMPAGTMTGRKSVRPAVSAMGRISAPHSMATGITRNDQAGQALFDHHHMLVIAWIVMEKRIENQCGRTEPRTGGQMQAAQQEEDRCRQNKAESRLHSTALSGRCTMARPRVWEDVLIP